MCKECEVLLDFKHCILDCSLNKQKSEHFIDQVALILPQFKAMDSEEKFIQIMNLNFGKMSEAQNESLTAIALSYIKRSYNDFLSGFWDSD